MLHQEKRVEICRNKDHRCVFMDKSIEEGKIFQEDSVTHVASQTRFEYPLQWGNVYCDCACGIDRDPIESYILSARVRQQNNMLFYGIASCCIDIEKQTDSAVTYQTDT